MSGRGPLRVLLAEDSAATREYLRGLLEADPALRVAGVARDGREAVEQAARLRPDVVLMDVHMPGLDGYTATREIMARVPTPIVMMSATLSREEIAHAFQAVEAGALALVEKPPAPGHPEHDGAVARLRETLRLLAEVRVVRRWPSRPAPAPPAPAGLPGARRVRVVAIGASTGGPAVLHAILAPLPRELPVPILVVQHIAPGFTAELADWLAHGTALTVKLADGGEPARPGTVYLAREGLQMGISREGRIRLAREPAEDGFCPSASYLFQSVAEACGAAALGILLTGMGRDGAAGLRRLREAGGVTVAQDTASAVVFGCRGRRSAWARPSTCWRRRRSRR